MSMCVHGTATLKIHFEKRSYTCKKKTDILKCFKRDRTLY